MADDDNWGMEDPAFMDDDNNDINNEGNIDGNITDNNYDNNTNEMSVDKTSRNIIMNDNNNDTNKMLIENDDDFKDSNDNNNNMDINNDDFNDDNDMDFDDNDFDDDFDDNNDDDWDDIDDANVNATNIGASELATQNVIQNTIPEVTTNAITNNCTEINMLPMFNAIPDLKSRSRIGAMLTINVSKLKNITVDQLEVWGLTKKCPFIGIKFEFGPYYLNEAKLPIVSVGMCDKINITSELKVFRLSWTIQDRLKNGILSNKQWPTNIDMKTIPDVSKINELMESTNKDYPICLQALKQTKYETTEALNILLDNNQLKRIQKRLPSNDEYNREFNKIMGKIKNINTHNNSMFNNNNIGNNTPNLLDEYKSADIKSKSVQLSEMFNIKLELAKFAIITSSYDNAITQMTSNKAEYLEQLTMAYSAEYDTSDNVNRVTNMFDNYGSNNSNDINKPKKKGWYGKLFGKSKTNNDDEKKENNNNNINDINSIGNLSSSLYRTQSGGELKIIKGEHLLKTIVTMNRHNFLLRILCESLKILLSANRYCIVCDTKLAFASLMPTICSSSFCQFRHDQIGLGFSLANVLKTNGLVVDLLITLTYSACNQGGRIRFFFPTGVRGLDDDTSHESFLMRSDNKDLPLDLSNFDFKKFMENDPSQPQPNIEKLKNVIDLCPSIEELKILANIGDVHLKKELKKKHALLYPLLCWIITSNRSHLRLLKNNERMKQIDTEYQFAICSSTPDREAEFQGLKENNGTFLAWHGSSLGNWHSIFRMGLRNYSGTKHQTNGRAYGSGIYFAKYFNLSWSYSKKGNAVGWSKSVFGTSPCLLALCEICYHKDDAKKRKNVFNNNSNNDNNGKTKDSTTPVTFGVKTTDPKNRWVKTSGIYVVDDERSVMTRFFLVFKTGVANKLSIDANNVNIPNVVREFE